MAYDAWTEGYLKAKQSKANKFDPNISIRFERVGNWIVSAKVLGGYKTVICIYHKKTLMEHWNTIKQSRLLDLRKHLIMLSKE